ncbi:MAG: hypothetical protein NTZ74_01780 [Chloroflexi bacterium]|nr:hypothetical protein [Chloroflexota bacterium]
MTGGDRLRDFAGAAFFLFAALLAGGAAWQHPSLLTWLSALHNGLLAYYYLRRPRASHSDRVGLWLGGIAAFLPSFSAGGLSEPSYLLPAVAAYALMLWSLVTLGPRFGIAPADRGLTDRGPYRFLRHPMYLGELLFRGLIALSSPQRLMGLVLTVLLAGVQVWRILREEKVISGYAAYARSVRWRLVPGVW